MDNSNLSDENWKKEGELFVQNNVKRSGRTVVFESVLSDVSSILNNKDTPINDETQLELEELSREQFLDFAIESEKEDRKKKVFGNINMNVFSSKVNEKLAEGVDVFAKYVEAHIKELKGIIKEQKKSIDSIDNEDAKSEYMRSMNYNKHMLVLMTHCSPRFIAKYCISFYLRIVSGIKNNDFSYCSFINTNAKMSKTIIDFYHVSLYNQYLNKQSNKLKSEEVLTYSKWFAALDNDIKNIDDHRFDMEFGINLDKPITEVVSESKFDTISVLHKIMGFKELSSDKFMVSYTDKLDYDLIKEHDLDLTKILFKHPGTFGDRSILIDELPIESQ